MHTQEEIIRIRARIASLKRQRAAQPNFGKQRSRNKDGMTKAEKEEFKAWCKAKKEKEGG